MSWASRRRGRGPRFRYRLASRRSSTAGKSLEYAATGLPAKAGINNTPSGSVSSVQRRRCQRGERLRFQRQRRRQQHGERRGFHRQRRQAKHRERRLFQRRRRYQSNSVDRRSEPQLIRHGRRAGARLPSAAGRRPVYSRKFTYCSGCSSLRPRTSAIADCRSSRFLAVTRNSPPCTAACTFILLSFISRTSRRASSASMP